MRPTRCASSTCATRVSLGPPFWWHNLWNGPPTPALRALKWDFIFNFVLHVILDTFLLVFSQFPSVFPSLAFKTPRSYIAIINVSILRQLLSAMLHFISIFSSSLLRSILTQRTPRASVVCLCLWRLPPPRLPPRALSSFPRFLWAGCK